MPKPTPEQLEKINKFTIEPLTEEDCYVFTSMMIDDNPTSYYSIITKPLLDKFRQDTERGIALLMGHNTSKSPVGRSFSAEMRQTDKETSLYGSFYIDLGRNTDTGMTTDDIVKGINAGTIFDTSIGFNAKSWNCSICGNDIRNFFACPHVPGKKYAVQNESGEDVVETCYVLVGEDGQGELLENSLVYAGACNRATIVGNFSSGQGVSDLNNSTKLHVIDDFKNVPVDATIYQYYTKDGSVLFTDTPERTNGAEYLRKRSEQEVELKQVVDVLTKFGIEFETPEQLSAALESLKAGGESVSELETELSKVQKELSAKIGEVEELQGKLSAKDEVIAELTKANEELTEKAGLAETYRADLINQALEAGVRAQGNAFQKPMYERFLQTLSIDEIKEVIDGFEAEFKAKFDGARVTEVKDRTKETRFVNSKTKEDFDSEAEYQEYVVNKAKELVKNSNGALSIREALKQVHAELTAKEGEEE